LIRKIKLWVNFDYILSKHSEDFSADNVETPARREKSGAGAAGEGMQCVWEHFSRCVVARTAALLMEMRARTQGRCG
jgi:hypothetical protein